MGIIYRDEEDEYPGWSVGFALLIVAACLVSAAWLIVEVLP